MEELRISPTGNGKIVSIPLRLIRPNPNNPRRVITEEQVLACQASLLSIGQRTPIKARTLTPEDMESDPAHEYELIGGHIRFEAAKRLKWEELQGIVLSLSAKEALLEGVLDNRGAEVFWLSLYESIEQMMQSEDKITQQQVADRLEVTQSTVSGALKLLNYLTQPAREVIYHNFISAKGGYVMPESCARRLTKLATGNTPVDQQRIEACIKVVVQQKLSEKSAAKLVEWVKKGNAAVTFKEDAKPGGAKTAGGKTRWDKGDPNAGLWQTLPNNVSVHGTEKGYRVTWDLKQREAAVAIYGGMVGLSHLWQSDGKGAAQANYKAILDDMINQATNEEQNSDEKRENN